MVLEQIELDKEINGLSLKEKAAYVARMFREAAEQRGITLKLRKKPKMGCK